MQVERFVDDKGEHTSFKLVSVAPGKSQQFTVETIRIGAKVGRNQPCPCGSGKKYKKCCWDTDRGAWSEWL
jgi:uncharacterized protein YecA (UPF0149 family)